MNDSERTVVLRPGVSLKVLLHTSQPSTDILGRRACATISAIGQVGKQRPIRGQLAPIVDEALSDQLGMKRYLPGRAFVFAVWDIEHPRRADPSYITRRATSDLIQTTTRKRQITMVSSDDRFSLAACRRQNDARLIVGVAEPLHFLRP